MQQTNQEIKAMEIFLINRDFEWNCPALVEASQKRGMKLDKARSLHAVNELRNEDERNISRILNIFLASDQCC